MVCSNITVFRYCSNKFIDKKVKEKRIRATEAEDQHESELPDREFESVGSTSVTPSATGSEENRARSAEVITAPPAARRRGWEGRVDEFPAEWDERHDRLIAYLRSHGRVNLQTGAVVRGGTRSLGHLQFELLLRFPELREEGVNTSFIEGRLETLE